MSRNFLDSSTIHGFKYLSKKFHWIERIFWTVSLIFSALFATFLIGELIIKINNFPIVIYLSEHATPISEINFPAVTFCPGINTKLFNASKLQKDYKYSYGMYELHTAKFDIYFDYDIRQNFSRLDAEIVGDMTYYELLQKFDKNEIQIENLNLRILKRLQIIDLVTRHGTFERKNLSIPTDNILYNFNEFSKFQRSNESTILLQWIERYTYMSEIITKHGLCYSFNNALIGELMDIDSTSADFHYELFSIYNYPEYLDNNNANSQKVPRRINVRENGFSCYVWGSKSFYKSIFNGLHDGHRVYIHDPYELPTKSTTQVIVSKHNSLYILLDPKLSIIDDSLKEFEVNQRNCYLEHEKKLKFFKVYTKANCEHECLADFVFSRCDCVEFYMIRNFTTRICSANEKKCFDGARSDFEHHQSYCRCLQPCNYIKYDVEVVQTSFREIDPEYNIYSNVDFFCGVKVDFTKTQFNQLIRKKHFNEVDFLSFVGGLLGLFAGFSALSFVEVIYWIFVKLIKLWIALITPRFYRAESTSLNRTKRLFIDSTIHGSKYLFCSSFFETFFWLFAFILSISFCLTLISQTNQKLPDSRVITYDENLESIGNIPFPAVSYLPGRLTDKFFSHYISNYFGGNQEWKEKIQNDEEFRDKFLLNITRYITCFHGPVYTFIGYNMSLKNYFHQVIKESSKVDYFRQQFASFNDKFIVDFAETQIFNGYGFSFNLLDAEDILDFSSVNEDFYFVRNVTMLNKTGLLSGTNISYPIIMNMNHKEFKFTLKLQQPPEYDKNVHAQCWRPLFAVHSSQIPPLFIDTIRYIEMGKRIIFNVEVTPEIIRTDDDLRKLSPEARECYFDGEMSLKYFKNYSQKGCEIECITNYTLKYCGCVSQLHLTNPKENINICYDLDTFNCTFAARHQLLASENFSTERNCSCLPTCNSISYNVKYFPEFDHEDSEATTINVRMRTDETILFRRYQQFTFMDVVSYVGGLLGLFAGISMLSLVEIFYFFTIRLGVNLWRDWRN